MKPKGKKFSLLDMAQPLTFLIWWQIVINEHFHSNSGDREKMAYGIASSWGDFAIA
ncbi:hypothetical protein [Microbulbifer variabilis]|uniref:hypothetical protein n=1 Tax=Microbulbifer variabilis TaxID=266805 RepID=UPI001CFCBA42|nr:hypothetical protein [Microbulbifer variabilis]